MPTIRDAVLKGPLNETERRVFEVLTNHPDHIFSTSVEDLAELAAWCIYPSSHEPPEVAKTPGETLSINDRISIWNEQENKEEAHCTLRTISIALASLAKTNRIWSGKLHFGEDSGEEPKPAGRTYYGEKQAHLRLADVLEDLNGESRAIGWFTTIKSGENSEETNEETNREADPVEEVLASFPPKIVALFRWLTRPGKDLWFARVPEEGHGYILQDAQTDPTSQPMPQPGLIGNLTLYEILPYGRIRSPVIELGSQLVGLGRAVVHVGPGYRNARWDATFFGVTGTVAQSIDTWLDDRGISLESTERLLGQLNLLGQTPAPPFCDFTTVGINAEALKVQLDTAATLGTISYGRRDQGAAFVVNDEESYQQLVLAPAFEKVVVELLS
jgi:hypothetical protein